MNLVSLKSNEEMVTCTHVIRPLLSAGPQCFQPTSLRQLIQPARGRPRLERLPFMDRIRLAKTLATAVLQYRSTPWLQHPWRCEDILFLNIDDEQKDTNALTAPHVTANIVKAGQEISDSPMPSSPHAIARNPLLFGLGVVFLEIAYKCPYEDLRRESDIGTSPDQRLNDFKFVERLADSGCMGMGLRYDNIVRKLIGCDFSFGTDLSKPQLQNAFYDAIIKPLSILEQEMQERF